jgi:hypothetical protein
MATLTSEGDEVPGDPPSPRLGVLAFFSQGGLDRETAICGKRAGTSASSLIC